MLVDIEGGVKGVEGRKAMSEHCMGGGPSVLLLVYQSCHQPSLPSYIIHHSHTPCYYIKTYHQHVKL